MYESCIEIRLSNWEEKVKVKGQSSLRSARGQFQKVPFFCMVLVLKFLYMILYHSNHGSNMLLQYSLISLGTHVNFQSHRSRSKVKLCHFFLSNVYKKGLYMDIYLDCKCLVQICNISCLNRDLCVQILHWDHTVKFRVKDKGQKSNFSKQSEVNSKK
jgi:hypothetical protein